MMIHEENVFEAHTAMVSTDRLGRLVNTLHADLAGWQFT
jgi:hypothetical protein